MHLLGVGEEEEEEVGVGEEEGGVGEEERVIINADVAEADN